MLGELGSAPAPLPPAHEFAGRLEGTGESCLGCLSGVAAGLGCVLPGRVVPSTAHLVPATAASLPAVHWAQEGAASLPWPFPAMTWASSGRGRAGWMGVGEEVFQL